MKIQGTVIKIGQVQNVSPKFKKVQIILMQSDVKYDAEIPIEFLQDKGIELAKKLKQGNEYNISVNIAGREWKDRHYISLKAWAVEEIEPSSTTQDNDNSDLPF